jgi:hypothetical protein
MDTLLLFLRLLLAGLLYGFLGAVLLIVWRDLRQTLAIREIIRPAGQLVVIQTESKMLVPGTVFPLQAITSIGRSPSNTLSLPDAFSSAHNALLTWREGQWWLEDRDSRNGTWLNGTRITEPVVISAGDIVGVGRTQLKLEME